MAVVNTSYLTDVNELAEYSDLRHVQALASRLDEDDADLPLTTADQLHRLDFVIQAMNTGARWIEAAWRKHYNLTGSGRIVDSVTATNPDGIIKDWNARLAVNIMEVRRANGNVTENRQAILDEMVTSLDPSSPLVFSTSRTQQVFPQLGGSVRPVPGALTADAADQFGNVIPQSHRRGTLAY